MRRKQYTLYIFSYLWTVYAFVVLLSVYYTDSKTTKA